LTKELKAKEFHETFVGKFWEDEGASLKGPAPSL